MGMVRCKDCQCWDQSDPGNLHGRTDWGICRRHAPYPSAFPNFAWGYNYSEQLKENLNKPKGEGLEFPDPSVLVIQSDAAKTIMPGTPETAGCWEGISKYCGHDPEAYIDDEGHAK